jgi:hypothetical protein
MIARIFSPVSGFGKSNETVKNWQFAPKRAMCWGLAHTLSRMNAKILIQFINRENTIHFLPFHPCARLPFATD